MVVVAAVAVLALQYVAFPPELPPPSEPCDSSTVGTRDYAIYRTMLDESISQPRIRDGATIFVAETAEVSDIYLSHDDFSVDKLPAEIVESGRNVVLSQDAIANFLQLSTETVRLDRLQFTDLLLVLSD